MTVRGSPDPYSFVTYNTGSYSETDSGATTGTLGEVNDFSDWESSSYADEYTITGPPASTVTDEATSTGTTSGDPRDTSNGTLIPAYWDTYAVGLATSMGTSPLDAPIQDGTTTGEWDTSKNLVSALGGQDMHALQFTGSEVQPALSGSAIVLEQGAGGSGTWVSHPSAIGYRRQGYVTSGSHGGSGSTTITIAAVAPEFDSGMNIGADQDETERLLNFSQGAEENPTVAQTQPTSRAVQQVSGISSGGDMMNPSYDNPTWRAGANPFGGNGYYSPFAGWFGGAGGGAGAGGEGGIVNAPAQTPNEVSMRMYPVSPGLSPGYTGSGPPPPAPAPPASPGPVPGSTSNVDPLTALAILSVLSKGAQTNNAQPAQGNVGPPQPGEDIGPISPDPYAGYVPFSYGGRDYMVPPDSAQALLDVLNVSSMAARCGEDPDLRELELNLSVFAQYSNPLLSVRSSQTHPDDVLLHYGMQGANVAALVDLPASGWNLGRNSWNLLRASRGLNAARGFAAGGEGVLALKTAAQAAGPSAGALYTGARRLVDPGTLTQEKAEAIYEWIRGLDAETNIATVARNTGTPEQVIRSVRQHVFFEEHALLDGSVRRFSADEGIATWWKAATEGGIPNAELERVQLIFAHEYVERSLMQTGMPYRLSESGTPMGAHELSPLVPNMPPGTPLYRPGVGPWDHTGLVP